MLSGLRTEDSLDIDGDMNIYDFFELIGLDEDDADEFESETAGGWMIEMLGHYPQEGEALEYESPAHEETKEIIELTALKVNDRRVEKIDVKIK